MPDGALTPGKHYTYSITIKDDLDYSPEITASSADHPEWNFTMDAAPDVPTNLTVDGQALTADVTSTVVRPEVCATVTDPDSAQVQAYFTIKQGGIVVVDSLAGDAVASGGTSCATMPYAISADATYTIEARGFDTAFLSDPVGRGPSVHRTGRYVERDTRR